MTRQQPVVVSEKKEPEPFRRPDCGRCGRPNSAKWTSGGYANQSFFLCAPCRWAARHQTGSLWVTLACFIMFAWICGGVAVVVWAGEVGNAALGWLGVVMLFVGVPAAFWVMFMITEDWGDAGRHRFIAEFEAKTHRREDWP